MDFNWNEPKPIDDQEFSSDNLDRAKYATYLTSLIKAKGGTEKNNLSNYVLNLDAEWGAGKTYFLKRWSEDLKGSHPVVYIDAWAIDYLEAPLMTVLSEIIEQLKLQTDKIDPDETQRKLNGVIKAAAPRIGSALMKRYLGFDFNIFDSAEPEDVTSSGSGKEVDFSKAGEKVLEVFCKEVTDSKESVKTLKLAIQSWVEYVIDNPVKNMGTIKNSYPAFIFIDELDRCKPTYAVEMLESIKHVFDIPGLVFVVATNTMQLSHTVKAVYGSEFNAEEYLSRFFNNRYYLTTELNKGLLDNHCNTELFCAEKLNKMQIILFPFYLFEKEKFMEFCISVFNAVKLSPRQAVKVFERVQLTFLNLQKDTCVNAALIVLLFATREKSLEMFNICWKHLVIGINFLELVKLLPHLGSSLKSIRLKIDLELDLVRDDFPFISRHVYDFENKNFNGHHFKQHEILLHELLYISRELRDLTWHADRVDRLVREDHPRDLQTEPLKYYIRLLQMKTDSKYYMDLTNMAVNLD
ncbi:MULTISPECIES: P-loop NTPase fold protein [unclassified Pseudoalteromonas]|uniref:KAP family P-loop NTPase fold protein n=1 Tax=unclassified Pseudoalteromonas TaxID=194690 RepID=UPI0025B55E94|nr:MULTISPECIES: P-loop NTPase fold protein [unclassified Pseudoalteromonas]MDN3377166.1 P-loop NTPase fold protein [Pseudoalteromonas sp. APC 3893]MDN3385666.1 P-loop NTPase fold protein [Pseudoalteromonas sp. APC 4017]